MKNFLIGVFILVVMIVTSVGATFYFLQTNVVSAHNKEEVVSVNVSNKVGKDENPITVSLKEHRYYARFKAIVDVQKRFLPDKDSKAISKEEILIKDTVIHVIRTKSVKEVQAENTNNLKKEIKEALEAKLGKGSIQNIYFTQFSADYLYY